MIKHIVQTSIILSISSCTFAASNQTTGIHLSVPASLVSTTKPLYVDQIDSQGAKQVAYINTPFYNIPIMNEGDKGNMTLVLQQQNGANQYNNCRITIKNDKVSTSTCQGVVNQPRPGNLNTNLNYIELAPNTIPVGSADNVKNAAAIKPINPNFNKTTSLIIKNDTSYQKIKVVQSGDQTTGPKSAVITKGQSITYQIPASGVTSDSFHVEAVFINGKWINIYKNKQVYGTKFEFDWGPVSTSHYQDVNFDVSLVDGMNIGYKLYPQNKTIAKKTSKVVVTGQKVASLWGVFDATHPFAQGPINLPNPSKVFLNLRESTLNNISLATPGPVPGLYSACDAANIAGNKQAINRYCCTNSDSTPQTCNAIQGIYSVTKTRYVNFVHQHTASTYAYAYDDSNGDYDIQTAQPLVLDLLNLGAINPTPTKHQLSPPQGLAADISDTTDVNLTWKPATDSYPNHGQLSYLASVKSTTGLVNVQQGTCNSKEQCTATFSGLKPDTQYQGTVTDSDKQNHSKSSEVNFTTKGNGPTSAGKSVKYVLVKGASGTIYTITEGNTSKKYDLTKTANAIVTLNLGENTITDNSANPVKTCNFALTKPGQPLQQSSGNCEGLVLSTTALPYSQNGHATKNYYRIMPGAF